MGKKPDLSTAFAQAESDAVRNADLLTRLQQRNEKPVVGPTQPSVAQPASVNSDRMPTRRKPPKSSTNDVEVTVSLSTRVSKSLRQRLKRISLHREEVGEEPSSIQQIVAEALHDWLERNRD